MTIIKLYYLNDWKKIKSYGWQTICNKDLVALKSPYNLHRCNLCWDVYPESMLQEIIAFYQDRPFFLYNRYDINSNYLLSEGKILEMKFETSNIKKINCHQHDIMLLDTQDIYLWSKVLANAINKEHKLLFLFIKTIATLKHSQFFLLYWQNMPVATSLLSIYDNNAILSFVTVDTQFRARGLGRTIILKTISFAYDIDIKTIYLYSADRISHKYEKIGFTFINSLYLYRSV
uniref:GNAT family N-acetyltransferase n=1 Tax=Rickettsia endosymbiont of Ixodes pacificus TaxID=1133329 RepID=UPI00155D9D53|nr:GNAT family N-acetyltransferase [Rickettsia endosymbiont of Ixodes pacificus]